MALLSACEGKDVLEQDSEVREKVSLEVQMSSSEITKAIGSGGDDESNVSDYQVLVYDMSSRMLETYASPDPSASSVTLQCTTGPKDIVVLANAPDMSKVVSYDAFVASPSLLIDNSAGELVMEGHAECDITSAVNSVTVNVRRVVAKVVLEDITIDFESDAYDAMDFVLKSAYLTNVAADKKYLSEDPKPTIWYNKVFRIPAYEADDLIYENLGNVELHNPQIYSDKHHFYCYPNPYEEDTFSASVWTPRPTRLVVEAELDGKLYYYPVSLPVLKQNTIYNVSLHIVRPGATSPEQDMDRYAASFMIKVEEWEGPENITETI